MTEIPQVPTEADETNGVQEAQYVDTTDVDAGNIDATHAAEASDDDQLSNEPESPRI